MQQTSRKSNRGSLHAIANTFFGALGFGSGTESNDTETSNREAVDESSIASENRLQQNATQLSTDIATDNSNLSDSSIAISNSTESSNERETALTGMFLI